MISDFKRVLYFRPEWYIGSTARRQANFCFCCRKRNISIQQPPATDMTLWRSVLYDERARSTGILEIQASLIYDIDRYQRIAAILLLLFIRCRWSCCYTRYYFQGRYHVLSGTKLLLSSGRDSSIERRSWERLWARRAMLPNRHSIFPDLSSISQNSFSRSSPIYSETECDVVLVLGVMTQDPSNFWGQFSLCYPTRLVRAAVHVNIIYFPTKQLQETIVFPSK